MRFDRCDGWFQVFRARKHAMPSYGGYSDYPTNNPELHVRTRPAINAVYYIYNHMTDVQCSRHFAWSLRLTGRFDRFCTKCRITKTPALRDCPYRIPMHPKGTASMSLGRPFFPPQD